MITFSESPRTLQVKCIFSEDPYDFQEDVNKALKKLGESVVDMQMSASLIPGFSCVISYWGEVSDDVSTSMER